MAKKVDITFNNPIDESNIDHLELWRGINGAPLTQLGADIAYLAGSADYTVTDDSAEVVDGAVIQYSARTYSAGGLFGSVESSIAIALPVEAMAADFAGYTRINTTNITLTDFVTFQDTGEAPFMLRMAATGVSATGSRFSGKALKALTDLDYRWTVTKADLSPVLYKNELLNPQDSSVYNPYTDTIGCEAAFYLREAGDYIVTCEVRGARTDGQVIKQTFSKTYTVTESTSAHKWYDPASGSGTNDGLDPWGFALTVASYDDTTRTITKVGAFTSLVMDTEYPQNSSNFIYLTGGTGINVGLYEIASKTSNDAIVLKKSAGATAVDVTSSNGPLDLFTGVTATTSDNGVIHRLKGGNTYDVTGELKAQVGWDGGTSSMYKPKGVWSYGGTKATILSTTVVGSEGLVDLSTNLSGSIPDSFSVNGLVVDGNGVNDVLGGTHTSNKNSLIAFSLVDCVLQKAIDGIGGSVQTTGGVDAKISLCFWGGLLDNKRLAAEGRSVGLYVHLDSPDSFYASLCFSISTISDNALLDHYIYENGTQNHSMHHHLHAYPPAGETGFVTSYTLNLNNSKDTNSRLSTTVVGGKFEGSDWGIDASNGTNAYDTKTFDNLYIYNVDSSINKSFFAAASCFNSFVKSVDHVSTDPYTSAGAFFHAGWGSGTLDKTAYNLTLEGNRVDGQGAFQHTTGINFEAYGNTSTTDWVGDAFYADMAVVDNNLGLGNVVVVEENKQYSPNNVSGNVFRLNGLGVTLAAFNSGVGGTNYDADPAWPDFPPALLVLTLGVSDKVLPINTGMTGQNEIKPDGLLKFAFNTSATGADIWSEGTSNSMGISNTGIVLRKRYGDYVYFDIAGFDALYRDGNWHTITITLPLSGEWSCDIDGITYAERTNTIVTTDQFIRVREFGLNGSIRNIELDDATLNIQWKVDSGFVDGSPEPASSGSGDLDGSGITSSDWA